MEDLGAEETLREAYPPWFRTKAVAVHLYTASGAVLALLILVAGARFGRGTNNLCRGAYPRGLHANQHSREAL